MTAAYHHGSETIRVNGGFVPISQVDGAIIGIVGSAPIGEVNTLKLCISKKDFRVAGEDILQKYRSKGENVVEQSIKILVIVTGLVPEDIDELDMSDFQRAAKVIEDMQVGKSIKNA